MRITARRVYSITSSARASSVRRHFEAERLRGLEVDHQLELGRLLNRQIGRSFAFEDRARHRRRLGRYASRKLAAVADQAAGGSEFATVW